MRLHDLYNQLRERRVIRASLIYIALVWAALQAADLFAGADIIRESTVRWLIVAGAAGFPIVVLASWFLESPWRERRWTAVAGDVVVIVAIGVAAALFAWQQWFGSFTRPTVAVLPFEATDTREDTNDLADHLAKRFRTILAMRPEVRVTESRSAMHPSLTGLDLAAKADALGAEYLLSGTLSRGEQRLRLSLQLYASGGERLWSDSFESPVFLQAQLQEWVLDALWPQLPLEPGALESAKELVANCHYPDDGTAILTLARTGRRGGGPALLAMVATADIEAGLLHLAQSQFYFDQLESLPPSQKPVVHKLAMRSLALAAASCPEHPHVELLRLINTNELQLDVDHAVNYLAKHPNSADLYLAVADLHAEKGLDRRVPALAREALRLDPLGEETQCHAGRLLESAGSDAAGCD
jgi:TolB-like protein